MQILNYPMDAIGNYSIQLGFCEQETTVLAVGSWNCLLFVLNNNKLEQKSKLNFTSRPVSARAASHISRDVLINNKIRLLIQKRIHGDFVIFPPHDTMRVSSASATVYSDKFTAATEISENILLSPRRLGSDTPRRKHPRPLCSAESIGAQSRTCCRSLSQLHNSRRR